MSCGTISSSPMYVRRTPKEEETAEREKFIFEEIMAPKYPNCMNYKPTDRSDPTPPLWTADLSHTHALDSWALVFCTTEDKTSLSIIRSHTSHFIHVSAISYINGKLLEGGYYALSFFKISVLFISKEFFNYFIEVWLTRKKLQTFNVYSSMSLGISIHLWDHHCHRGQRHIHDFPKCPPLSLLFCLCAW